MIFTANVVNVHISVKAAKHHWINENISVVFLILVRVMFDYFSFRARVEEYHTITPNTESPRSKVC